MSLKELPQMIIITMLLQGNEMTTTKMPYLATILKKELPTILRSKCFNEKNIPFSKELLSTELGHLFEHILLEYLCIFKMRMGFEEAMFSGMTKWDWNNDPYGTFHIEVTLPKDDRVFFTPALSKTSVLFEKILFHHQELLVQRLSAPDLIARIID